ncbi:uncharacterized protein [Rutidosis leptorrhynchoides]|uniref:uncharacterized protein n=1 Tax=Rutidosis leptorrhynchoides TaxID=125765 RepID=UPI003A99B4BF
MSTLFSFTKTYINFPFLDKQQKKFVLYCTKDEKKIGNWDQMEMKFGKLIGQNPKLTLSKIKDINLNPEHEESKRPVEKAPNVILWNAAALEEDNDETMMSPFLSLKPNLSLKLGKEEGMERFSDMILVKNELSRSDIDVRNNHLRNVDRVNRLMEADSVSKLSTDATLHKQPKRLDQPVKKITDIDGRITMIDNLIANFVTRENSPPILHSKDREDMDWKRADDLIQTTGRGEVEMISCSTRGFVVSFGSLIGFLPYRYLATKWKFLAFESWLRIKGVDPVTYRKSLGVIGNFDSTNVDTNNFEGDISSHMKLEDHLALYDQEKLQYLSSFVGQKIKVNVIMADKDSRKLIFSVKPKEQEESIQRKQNLMAKLKVGDIVTCCIKKITYFGIFVEIEGVPALIHQTEVSWDATLNPTSCYKVGQVVEAKVHQLDFSLERISLSLKEISPDPLTKSLDAVLGDNTLVDGTLEAAQPENEWADLELLVKELQRYEGIELVTKGPFFLSPGLTPDFQVYMASMFKNQYKLLARAGNKVQEVVVQTWLGTEEMKHAILRCTNRIG